jgi:uncharacterized protein YjbJ (UPF0337 family)
VEATHRLGQKEMGQTTDDELMQIDGNRDVLAGKLQERYS